MTLPPSPATNSSNSQKAASQARYAKVKHLSDASAAAKLGVTVGSVRSYRRQYPDLRPAGWLLGNQVAHGGAKPQTPSGGAKKRVREFICADGRVNRVSLAEGPF